MATKLLKVVTLFDNAFYIFQKLATFKIKVLLAHHFLRYVLSLLNINLNYLPIL